MPMVSDDRCDPANEGDRTRSNSNECAVGNANIGEWITEPIGLAVGVSGPSRAKDRQNECGEPD
jgi:hypothetical protein